MRICPKCKYVRQATDTAPDWQCPACEVAYAKAADALAGREYVPEPREREAPASSLRHVTWALLAVLVVAFLLYGKLRKAPPRLSVDAPIAAQGSTRESRGAQPSVVLYATSWCGYCKATREFFADYGIRYVEHDIEASDPPTRNTANSAGRACRSSWWVNRC